MWRRTAYHSKGGLRLDHRQFTDRARHRIGGTGWETTPMVYL